MTAEEFAALPVDGSRHELLAGEVVEMVAPGFRHAVISARLGRLLGNWAEARAAGVVTDAAGYIIQRNPDTVRVPDVAFVAAEHLPEDPSPQFLEQAPDLVIEVASPNDRRSAMQAKAVEWAEAGVRLVWLVLPETKRVIVFSGADDVLTLTEADTLTGEPVLPGFALPVAEIFA